MKTADLQYDGLECYGFIYGDAHVPYRIERREIATDKPRKVAISVHPDCRVVVSAPADASNSDIHDAVMKRAKWIVDNVQAFSQQQAHVQTRRYVSGEMQFYLGRRYVLKVSDSIDAPARVKLERGNLVVTLRHSRQDKATQVKALLSQWYRARAQHVFEKRFTQLLPQAHWVSEPPNFRVLPMVKQWGSCSVKGTLMLNPHLVKAPRHCVDYVILHELCHIAEHNHSKRFYRLLAQVMPDWRATKQELDGMAELLLNE